MNDSDHVDLRSDVSTARRELGFRPMPPEEAVDRTLVDLRPKMHRRAV